MNGITACDRTIVDSYVESLSGDGREWVAEMIGFMRENFPQAKEGMCGDAPAYALGSRNVCFAATESCFIFTTDDSDCIDTLKMLLPDAILTEDSIMVGYDDAGVVWTLLDALHDIARK